jgi:hypothetical protein
MGGACEMYGGEERFIQVFGRETGKRPFGRSRGRWRIILKWIFKAWGGETWTFDLGHGRYWWRALLNDVMNFLFCKMWGVSCLAEDLLASQVRLYPMELVGWLVGRLVRRQLVIDAFRHVSPNCGETL